MQALSDISGVGQPLDLGLRMEGGGDEEVEEREVGVTREDEVGKVIKGEVGMVTFAGKGSRSG